MKEEIEEGSWMKIYLRVRTSRWDGMARKGKGRERERERERDRVKE